MTGFKKSASVALLTLGLCILGVATVKLQNPQTPPQDKLELQGTIILLGLPLTLQGGMMVWQLYRDRQQAIAAMQQQQRDRLHALFFQQLLAHHGKITVIHFAMAANLSGSEARQFLDRKAVEFNADFEVSDRGDISYWFPL